MGHANGGSRWLYSDAFSTRVTGVVHHRDVKDFVTVDFGNLPPMSPPLC